jgi:Tfp pilus assembly protein PilV
MYFAEQDLPKKLLDKSNGFVLLEVLLAMSLILGSWMTMLGAYQNLTLRFTQEESKRVQLRKELDAFEISEHLRANDDFAIKGLINESPRMPGRTRTQHGATKSSVKNKR